MRIAVATRFWYQKKVYAPGSNARKCSGSELKVQVHSDPEPEPPMGFMFDGLAEPNPEHNVRFGFEHCSQCS